MWQEKNLWIEFDCLYGFHSWLSGSHTNQYVCYSYSKYCNALALQLPASWCLTKHPNQIGDGRPSCSLSWQAGRRKRGEKMKRRQGMRSVWTWEGQQSAYFSGQSIQTWMSPYQPTWIHKTSQIYRTLWTSFTSSCTCQSWAHSDRDK